MVSVPNKKGNLQGPPKVFIEINPKDDKFKEWLSTYKEDIVLAHGEKIEFVRRVINEGYGGNPEEVDLDQIGGDPFLIASALEDLQHRCVVTEEISKPSRQGFNRKIPDVCKDLQVKCINMLKFVQTLGFKTNWREEIPDVELMQYSGSGPSDQPLFDNIEPSH